jgi:hypothetical protein
MEKWWFCSRIVSKVDFITFELKYSKLRSELLNLKFYFKIAFDDSVMVWKNNQVPVYLLSSTKFKQEFFGINITILFSQTK